MTRSANAVARRQRDETSGVEAGRASSGDKDRRIGPRTRRTATMGAGSALRDEDATIPCPVCAEPFVASGRRRYCSDRCRCRAWRRRRPAPVPVAVPPAGPGRRAITVYECAACGTRALGEQRCDECGSFMGRVGIGGLCPHCDEPVAVSDLVAEVVVPTPVEPARRASTTPLRPATAPARRRQP